MKRHNQQTAQNETRALLESGLTYDQAAEKLGVDRRTVARRVKRWSIPHLAAGGRTGEQNGQYKEPHMKIWKKEGYIKLYRPGHPFCDSYGYMLEHRLVMEEIVGRFLRKEEVVHHKDHKRDNNSPCNLMLFACQRDHVLYERKEAEEQLRLSKIKMVEEKYGLSAECPY